MSRVAAIDLGTNSALLLVAESDPSGQLVEVEDHCETPRLGEGLGADPGSAELHPAAVERTLSVLAEFRDHCDRLGVPIGNRRAVSTAVLRRVANPAPFLTVASACLGHGVEVLSGEREAALGWRAVSGEDGVAPLALVDVGGGSTEVLSEGGSRVVSVPWGAVVLTERFLAGGRADLDPSAGIRAMETELERSFSVFRPLLRGPETDSGDGAGPSVVALGGTGANLHCLERGVDVFDHRLAEGATVTAEGALRWGRRLAAMGPLARSEMPVEPSRADILAAGCLALGHALRRLGSPSARVSGRGIRFGVARELLDLA